MEYLIIDIGTSSLRVLVMEEDGNIIDSAVKSAHAGQWLDAELLWETICSMAGALPLSRYSIKGIAVSALLGYVGMDEKRMAVSPCYTYSHTCTESYRLWESKKPSASIYKLTGRRPNPELGIFQLLHMRETDPDAYQRMAAFLTLKDFINAKLTGVFSMDRTSACYTMVYDVESAVCYEPLLCSLEVDKSLFPALKKPTEILGTLTRTAAEALGLPAGIPVAVGSVDGSTGILGAGGTEPGTLVSVMGTTDTSFLVTEKPLKDPEEALVLNPHVIPDRWLSGGPMGMYGGTVDWFSSDLLAGKPGVAELTKAAGQIKRGSEGLLFFPTLAGERTPFWEPAFRGSILGLETRHGSAHIFRALMEGNAYVLRTIAELAQSAGGEVKEVIAIGGGAANDVWLQIKAEVLGVPVKRTRVKEATSRGSCLLLQEALGQKPEAKLPAEHIFWPDEMSVAEYSKVYALYKEVHESLVHVYRMKAEAEG